ncbi:hypothetical protein HK097_000144 [Rhizophlyctis rosea]|uniref:Major facilitator superfamily (MFS) profile domain-containing protein n=1 Tax=Rhizophlyctis rosea TaxID=64517 RepID=A0AAD5S5Y7_9FUNG|nr:hypothetical protein HK097_000144 [Rhizophlyctis rosea]
MGTNVRNWPAKHRGIAVGIPIGFLGLAAAIFAAIASIFFYHSDGESGRKLDVGSFLTFMGATTATIAFQAAFTLRDVRHLKPEEPNETEDATDEDVTDEGGIDEPGGAIDATNSEQTTLLRSDDQHSTSLRQLDTLLLTGVIFAIGGAGLTYINTVGAIIVALSPPDQGADSPSVQTAQKFHVALLSVASCSGRIVVGILSDQFERKFHISRLFWPLCAISLMLAAQVLGSLTGSLERLVWVTGMTGAAYGAANTAFPVVVAHLFGADGFSTNWWVLE